MKSNRSPDKTTLWIIIITVVMTILIVAGVSLSGKSGGAGGGDFNTSQLQAAESSYDFGSISMAKGKVKKVFTFKNNTAAAIQIKKLYTSCMCTQATLMKSGAVFGPFGMPAHGFSPPTINDNIEPGQDAQIEVVFDPAAHGPAGVGPIERQATLETSDGQLVFKFKAQVTP